MNCMPSMILLAVVFLHRPFANYTQENLFFSSIFVQLYKLFASFFVFDQNLSFTAKIPMLFFGITWRDDDGLFHFQRLYF